MSMCQTDWASTDTSSGTADVASGAKLSEDDEHEDTFPSLVFSKKMQRLSAVSHRSLPYHPNFKFL